MFGLFGKKKIIEERIFSGIVMEISMFMCWYEDTFKKMLPIPVVDEIAKRVLIREGYTNEYQHAGLIPGLAYGTERKYSITMRKKTNFDAQVDGFLKSISITKADVSSW